MHATLPLTHFKDLRDCIDKLYVYYVIAGDISSAFADVSRRYIMPSIDKVDSLRLSSTESQSGDIEEMIKGIAHYSKKAQEEIRSLVEQVCDSLLTNLWPGR